VIPVLEQIEPDPEFSTVTFPNPEEPASLKMAMEVAEQEQCTVVIANDPDADRLAVAEYQKE
jgi:phosphomannomutase